MVPHFNEHGHIPFLMIRNLVATSSVLSYPGTTCYSLCFLDSAFRKSLGYTFMASYSWDSMIQL